MAINKNHEFEDLDGSKCAVVEKNVSENRVAFLRELLAYNKYTVLVLPSPPPKPVSTPVSGITGEAPPENASTTLPETYTIGVTDVMFNSTNAIFGRLLKTPDGHVVTLAYWNQKETIAKDEIPYFENII